jgi:hypothetical protein
MRLASRVKRLEARSGSCPVCGGAGGLAIVLGDEPAPPGCRRCGRPPLVMRFVVLTKEEWDAQQQAVHTRCPS